MMKPLTMKVQAMEKELKEDRKTIDKKLKAIDSISESVKTLMVIVGDERDVLDNTLDIDLIREAKLNIYNKFVIDRSRHDKIFNHSVRLNNLLQMMIERGLELNANEKHVLDVVIELHDIGKLLTVYMHSVVSADIVSFLLENSEPKELVHDIIDMVECHADKENASDKSELTKIFMDIDILDEINILYLLKKASSSGKSIKMVSYEDILDNVYSGMEKLENKRSLINTNICIQIYNDEMDNINSYISEMLKYMK